ncbi:MAG: acyltransferase family protein, partial [Brevundimonas sp.]
MSVAPARTDRRGDIQGLRAVGALLVAVFHIWFARVSGGVDVFFVVSGFLLIGSLGRETVAKGSVDLIRYGAKLAKRLLPASLFVLVAI